MMSHLPPRSYLRLFRKQRVGFFGDFFGFVHQSIIAAKNGLNLFFHALTSKSGSGAFSASISMLHHGHATCSYRQAVITLWSNDSSQNEHRSVLESSHSSRLAWSISS